MSHSALPGLIRFGRATCADAQATLQREWWLGNGRMAYAGGTIAGHPTRRYHGLLIAPIGSAGTRHLVFAKAEAILRDGGQSWPLFSAHWHDGTMAPDGTAVLESFYLDGRMPVWRFAIAEHRVEQRIWLEPSAAITYVAWRLESSCHEVDDLALTVALLGNFRQHHQVCEVGHIEPTIVTKENELWVDYTATAKVRIATRHGALRADRTWIENVDLAAERERGLEDCDHHLRVGFAELPLAVGRWVGLCIALNQPTDTDLVAALKRCQDRDRALIVQARTVHPVRMESAPAWIEQLVLSASEYVCARPDEECDPNAIIAGYPWFGELSRASLIALPGLTLATGRFEVARRILYACAERLDEGLLSNDCNEIRGHTGHNAVDAALWYILAWYAYIEASADRSSLGWAFPVLDGIIVAYRDGTRHGIGMDSEDELIYACSSGIPLTWMDSKVGESLVTPRQGKPVEVNALWYNALRAMQSFAALLGKAPDAYRRSADRVRASFSRFQREDGLGLKDVIDGPDGNDLALRSNQILVVSLPDSPLTETQQVEVVCVCGHELLTSHGLRTLGRRDPAYHGHYRGGIYERDEAYHQGTAWGWLLGHYIFAEYKVCQNRALAEQRLRPLADHLSDAGLGHVSEVFDGEPPHCPRGAPAQACAVGCTLETWAKIRDAN